MFEVIFIMHIFFITDKTVRSSLLSYLSQVFSDALTLLIVSTFGHEAEVTFEI